MSNQFVVYMGIGTVFIGLISLVLLCYITSAVCKLTERTPKAEVVPAAVPQVAPVIENRQEIIAAVAAAAAEDMGTDISAIRILSFKKL